MSNRPRLHPVKSIMSHSSNADTVSANLLLRSEMKHTSAAEQLPHDQDGAITMPISSIGLSILNPSTGTDMVPINRYLDLQNEYQSLVNRFNFMKDEFAEMRIELAQLREERNKAWARKK